MSTASNTAQLAARDSQLVQIVDAAFADSAKRSGEWLLCRKGCTQCCHGVFAIDAPDILRLHRGMEALRLSDPSRAALVMKRAEESVERHATGPSANGKTSQSATPAFPGDPTHGWLDEGPEAEARFADFANDEPCPALSADGACDLYEFRPMTCRVFGPPVLAGDPPGLAVCDICFDGATNEQIAACEMKWDDSLGSALIAESEQILGNSRKTTVAYAVLSSASAAAATKR